MAKKIALDAGHGLKTYGKQTPDGIKEWTLNDKVRDKIVSLLKGYDVEFIFPDNNEGKTDESLSSRISMYLSKGADVMVSIHHNAFKGVWGTATGVEVYTDKNPTAADKELANLIYSKLPKYTGLKGRGVKKEAWYVINQNKIPAVLVEGGFMDNKKDYKVITSDKGQEGYAKAVAEAIIEFLDLKKKDDSNNKGSKTSNGKSFKVKFLEEMNVRKGAGTKYKKVTVAKEGFAYAIVKTKTVKGVLWGKLKSGSGWVCIDSKYCKMV